MARDPVAPDELKKDDAQFWAAEIEAAKIRHKDWYSKAEEAEEQYRDEKPRMFGGLNIFWANVETQKAAIGEDFGKPQVSRVNAPESDGGLSRHVSAVWERTIAAAVKDTNDNHDIGLAVGDVFLPGKGTVWVDLEIKDEGDDEDEDIRWACAPITRVMYKDYLEGPATRWGDVPWVARGHYFTQDELISECKMSAEDAKNVPLTIALPYDTRQGVEVLRAGQEQFMRARVWEIWTKWPKKGRLYYAEGYDKPIRWDDDPFKLKNFFPCPRSMLANGDEGWQKPITDFSRYRDQALELNRVSERIFVLTDVLRRRGVFDKKFKELQDLASAADNTLIAVENFAELAKGGGLLSVMLFEDMQPTVTVLAELHNQREKLIQLIFELSGISDLARGQTDPNETLGAQRLKMSYGAGRFKARERESRRMASEAYAIKGELVAEHFPRKQIEEMSGISLPTRESVKKAKEALKEIQQAYNFAAQAGIQLPPPDPENIGPMLKLAQTKFTWEDVRDVLRSDYRRCYSVEVETDQTNFVDEEADKKARTEFFQVMMNTLQTLVPLMAQYPEAADTFKHIAMFVLSSFKAGRGVEEGLEQSIDAMIEKAKQAAQQPPADDPVKAVEMQTAQARLQREQLGVQRAQVDLQTSQQKAQAAGVDMVVKQQTAQAKIINDQQQIAQKAQENRTKAVSNQIEVTGKVEKLQFERAHRATADEVILKGPTIANPTPA